MKKLVVVLVVVCATLGGALYATAAPSGPPRLEIRLLKLRVAALEKVVRGLCLPELGCVKTPTPESCLWGFLQWQYEQVQAGKPLPDPRAYGCL